MKFNVEIEATHENKPATVNLQIEMDPKEMIHYVSEVMPMIKTVIQGNREDKARSDALWERQIRMDEKDREEKYE